MARKVLRKVIKRNKTQKRHTLKKLCAQSESRNNRGNSGEISDFLRRNI